MLGERLEITLYVIVFPVFAITRVQVFPPSVDFSTLYPVIGEPPLDGANQEILICIEETYATASPVGWLGTVAALVVAETVLDGELVPAELIAETR